MKRVDRSGPAASSYRASGADGQRRVPRYDDDLPRSRRGAETRARLVEAATAVFEEKGFFETRVADIVERAELSHGSFYHYFDSKEDIFREIAAAMDHALTAGMDIILDSSSSAMPRERIAAALRIHFEAYRKDARIMSVVKKALDHDEQVRAHWDRLYRQHCKDAADSIERLQRRGLADPGLDPAVTAAAMGTVSLQFAEQWLVQGYPACDFDTGVEQITRFFINVLQLRDPKKPRSRRKPTD